MRLAAWLALTGILFAGCGLKGPLTLPVQNQPAEQQKK
jgi:predicted small lipoprotein YifL